MGFSLRSITRSIGSVFKPVAQILPVAGAIGGAILGGPVGAAAGGALGRFAGGRISGDEHGIESLKGAAKAGALSGLASGALLGVGNLTGAGMTSGNILKSFMPTSTGGGWGGGILDSILGTGGGAGGGAGGGGFLNTASKWLPLVSTGLQYFQGREAVKAAEKAAEQADPFGGQRGVYQGQLRDLMSDPGRVANEPGYQFGLEQGLSALDRVLASQGKFGSGQRPIEMTKFATDYAQNRFDAAVSRLSQLAGANIAPGGTNASLAAAKWGQQNLYDSLGQLGIFLRNMQQQPTARETLPLMYGNDDRVPAAIRY